MRPTLWYGETRRYDELKEVDLEADRKILSEIHVKMLVDQNTDVNEEMSYIAEDAVLVPPNGPLIEGKEVFEALIKNMKKTEWDLGKPGRGVKTLEISASGDLAYDIGKYDIVNKTPEGPVRSKGYFVTLYKKIEGQWKFMGQIWNNIEPK
jgi:ketosteroid isomerase-like protein